MSSARSCVFLTMPTSGTGSLWRILKAITKDAYTMRKVAEEYVGSGRTAELPNWVPEPSGHLYMYNTPHIANKNLGNPDLRLIVNFRDPRDLSCNQFHWAMQHPILGRSEQEIAEYRARVQEQGLDKFALSVDNNVQFNAFKAIESRLRTESPDVLLLSYNQLCLDFDNMLARIAAFFGVEIDGATQALLEKERTDNLGKNPAWIGQIWSGSDTMPGRHRAELAAPTILALDDKYRDNLALLRSLEIPRFRRFFATARERGEMEMVLFGKDDQLFLTNDANDVIGQTEGRKPLGKRALFQLAMVHRARRLYGQVVGEFRYEHFIVPNKEVVLRNYLPPEVRFEGEGARPITEYMNSAAVALWKPYYEPGVLQSTDSTQYFPRTDTHWNYNAAFRYLREFFRERLSAYLPALEAMALRRFTSRQQGDLGIKLGMPPEEVEIIAPSQPTAKLAFTNGVANEGCVRWYRNPEAPVRDTVLVLHDSFGLWLTGILPEIFRQTIFVHGTLFDVEFIDKLRPAVVLCEQVERFLPRIPVNDQSLEAYVDANEVEKNAEQRLSGFLADPRLLRL